MTHKTVVYKYGTGNPVEPNGSVDVRDGIDNLQSFDVFMNAEEDTYNQRDGGIVKTVSGMENKFDSMIVDMNYEFDHQINSMGYTRVGTFATGATLTNPRQTLLWELSSGGDGQEYGWSGSFMPSGKIVPPNSTPLTTGGIAVGAWMSRFDPMLHELVNPIAGQYSTLEYYGVSATNTPEGNAAAFKLAVQSGKQFLSCFGTYSFRFDGVMFSIPNTALSIDMGLGKHVFENFGGIDAPELIDFYFRGRLNANGTFFRSLIKAHKSRVIDMPDFELSDVTVDNPVDATRELKVFDLSGSGVAPGQNNELMFTAGNMRFARIHTQSASTPQSCFTAFGNRGFVGLEHQIQIDNLEIRDWYSTDTAGNYVQGESDFFRMYTNPLNMEIGTLSLINAAHRVFKFKNVARVNVGVCNSYIDGAVIPANLYTAVFTTQSDTAAVTDGSIITIDTLNIDHPRLAGAGATAGFWSSDGLSHSMKIGFMRFKNFNAFVSNATGGSLIIDGGIGEGLSINAPTLDVAHIKNLVDTKFVSAACKKNIFENCELTPHPDRSLSGYPINNAYLWSTNFNNWKSDLRVAFLKDMRDCSITYTSGAAATIPFRLDGSTRFNINRFVMAQTGGVTVTGFADSVLAGAQAFTMRDVYVPNATSIAFLTAGTWAATFDNCTITTTTGAGVTTKKVAQYV